jgi:hypothetical protein
MKKKNPESLSGFVFKGIKVIILFYKKNKNIKMPLNYFIQRLNE